MATGETAHAFLQREATVDERGTSHVTQKKYLEFMANNGVTAEVLRAISDSHEELLNGMHMYNSERLKTQVEEAKKAGRNPFAERTAISVNIPNGSINLAMTAAKVYPIPRKPGESVTRTCVCSLDWRQERLLDKTMCANTEAEMAKQLGL